VYLFTYDFQFQCLKTSIPIPSSVSGVIEELLVADGDTVTAGTDLCRIRVTGEFFTSADILI